MEEIKTPPLSREEFERKNKIIYNEKGYFLKNKKSFFRKPAKNTVTVVTPVYNAEAFIEKTIDSVLNQTHKTIEYILVDDGSTDRSREILLDYANKNSSITAVFLKENTGTPAHPRNLGIELSTTDYITFLDADDWFEPDAIETMFNILEETNDDYIVGKTLEVGSKGMKIVGEHESVAERRSISPYTIPHIFQHLGPRARMVRTSVIKENNIKYPKMKFAEDKQFFIDVLVNSKTISTTRKVLYYLNRADENDASLTKQTDVMEKMDCNLAVIHHVRAMNLDTDKEKMILNRLYEFDSITRLFNRWHFLKSEDKQPYFDKFDEVLATAKDLQYNMADNFFHPINKFAYELFIQGKYDQLEKLYRWDKKEKIKDYVVEDDGMPYMICKKLEKSPTLIRVPMLATFKYGEQVGDHYLLSLRIYGDFLENVSELLIRSRKDVTDETTVPLKRINEHEFHAELSFSQLEQFSKGSYGIFVRYNEYQKINISKEDEVKFNDRLYKFYTTVNSNLGLSIES
ncbi:glycosyltransferase family 2 protein [Terribacillus saccharophilus]|uniref:Glycosyl transferase n=1 Tax=Terribacillus saccharophilus TaxID=361277 RepID=A0ABX4GXU2_9BACI|nr:glycosyltransferase family A protein [Terribacillus saccharophilus]PAD35238.1 glycosyl transferase [Terribacillus saccharophilus]PAD95987.1 glycosyl transferase [Terribacillus saccharophilus]PAD99689.1 glycosyl transferase [Terribacillus saccharophilus]